MQSEDFVPLSLQGLPAAGCSRVHALPPGSTAHRAADSAAIPQPQQSFHWTKGQKYHRDRHLWWHPPEWSPMPYLCYELDQTRSIPRSVCLKCWKLAEDGVLSFLGFLVYQCLDGVSVWSVEQNAVCSLSFADLSLDIPTKFTAKSPSPKSGEAVCDITGKTWHSSVIWGWSTVPLSAVGDYSHQIITNTKCK